MRAMSTFTVPVVRIEKKDRHPDADTLSITEVEGCPVLFKTTDLNVGDLAVYIPIESVIKEESVAGKAMPFLKFKGGKHRVKAIKLRGIFSMGLLMPATAFEVEFPALSSDVNNVAELLGIEKYEEPDDEYTGGKNPRPGIGLAQRYSDCDVDPGLMPKYDMESYRKYKDIFHNDDGPMEVVVTEKCHGTSSRYIHDGTRLWVGSHRTWRRNESINHWTQVAKALDLETRLAQYPRIGIFGEIYGWSVQDLAYGAAQGELRFAIFDAFDADSKRFLNWDEVVELASQLGLPTVPVLYRGPMNAAIIEPLADGKTTMGGDHIREGIVIKPVKERWNRKIGRTIAKLVSQDYLLRPGGSERH